MSVAAKKRATYEDLLAAPDTMVAEIIDGELITSPRPAPPHALAGSVLGVDLGGPFFRGRGGPGGWWILFEPELHFGDDVLVPDIAGWRVSRMPALPKEAYFTLSPDWICEVLSERSRRRDRVQKMAIYARVGVAHAWLVDPTERSLEVFRLERKQWVSVSTHHGAVSVCAEPFAAVALDLAGLWNIGAPSEDR